MELSTILKDQKQELEEGLSKKKIIKRELEGYFNNPLKSKLIKVISGIRRCGKSVFIYIILKNKNFAYINFDDERIYDINTDQLLDSFYEVYGKDFKLMFLDEIQNLHRWELFINRLHRAGFNIFLTGSNSKLLGKELATHLTGRHMAVELFPFSFREYLKSIDFSEDIKTTRGMALIKQELRRYLKLGGFPEIILDKENPGVYIRELYRKIMEGDIINRHAISYKKTFKEIAMNLLSNPGRAISYNKIKKQFGLGSEHTVKNYLSYLEEAYIIFLVSKFSHKPIEIEKSEKKVYVFDTAVINNLSIRFREDYGHLYENVVAVELARQKSFNPDIEIYYWKNIHHEEVDFVVKQKLKVKQLIQVCYNMDDYDTKKREINALLKASKEIRCKDLMIVTDNHDYEEKVNGIKIKVVPLWKWLLGT